MPFRSKHKGRQVYWKKPSDEEIQQNHSRILADTKDLEGSVLKLPESLQAQIEETLEGGRNLAGEITSLMEAGPVDIIVPVHNGLHVVKKCLNSILERTKYPYHLYIIDDASDEHTQKWLKDWVAMNKFKTDMTLVINKKNRGFCATCNRGVEMGNNPFLVLQNSDTIVTEGWLTKMVRACLADKRNAIINPATNNTALIGVPLRNGFNYQQMNKMLELKAPKYPIIMPTGFCFFVRRKVWEQIGGLDEGFKSYGEESDFWMRTLKCIDQDTGEFPQYRSVLADDTYIFHERGSSFSVNDPDEWMKMRKIGSDRFHMLHPDFRKVWQMEKKTTARLETLKNTEVAGVRENNRTKSKYNITWLTHSTSFCGGMKFIADIVNELNEQGVNASVCNVLREGQEPTVPLAELTSAPYVFSSKEDCLNRFATDVFEKGIVVSATGELGDLALRIAQENKDITTLNHLQSWDVGQVDPKDRDRVEEILFNIYRGFDHTITNAYWLTDTLVDEVGVTGKIETVQPGVDYDMFYPGDREEGDERLTFALMLNPQYPFKGTDRGIDVAKELEKIAKEKHLPVRFLGVGVHAVQNFPKLIGLGTLAPARWAKMLREEVDVLIDPSYLHTYGLPGAEALVSSVKFVGWENKGIREYATDNTLILNNEVSSTECAQKIFELAEKKITSSPVEAPLPCREGQVYSFIQTLNEMFDIHKKSKVCIVTPHVRKFGGPTTLVTTANLLQSRGYDVTVCSVYSDSVALELTDMCKVPLVFGIKHMPKCDVVFVPSDSDMHQKIQDMGRFKKRVLYKLSHNARFKVLEEQGLQHEYDKILTSTEWLKDVCERPVEGWNYPPRKATRVGWYNYEFPRFNCPPTNRTYNKYKGSQVVIGGLVHKHPLKGTNDLMNFHKEMYARHGKYVKLLGVGEDPAHNHLQWFEYYLKLGRRQMAELFKQIDIWMSFSHTEGLGRLPLEAMSAGCAVVASDTGCEFLHDGGNSLLFPVGDVEAAIKQAERLLEDEKLLSRIVTEGYETAKAYADPTPYITQVDQAIEEVLPS